MRFLDAIKSFLFLSFLISLPAHAMEFRTGDSIEVQGSYSDNLFVAGGEVHAQLQSIDDVFMAAGQINLEGDAAESLWLAAGNLSLRNLTTRYGVLAGGNVLLVNSTIRELIAAGGSVRLQKIEIQDDLVLAGGKIFFDKDSNVKGSATIAGGEVTLAGHFSGEVRVTADELKLDPSLVIEGNLTHKTASFEVAEGARILGQTKAMPMEEQDWFEGGVVAMGFAGVLFFLGCLLIVPILAILFPKVTDQGSAILRKHFWESLGKGVVAAVVALLVWSVLLASVIGTPIALISIPFLAVAKMLAWTIAIFSVATLIRGGISKKGEIALSRKGRFGWTLLASLVVGAVFLIPILGFLLILLLFFAGFGALYLEMKHRCDDKALS